jgi:branched-chain amino acid transport system ATP-binding protein
MQKNFQQDKEKGWSLQGALATDPKLLLMDEVTGGVDQKTIPGLVELVKKLRDRGVTVITIEHNINIIMDISNHVLALDQGKKIAFGQPKEIQNNQKVIDAYLGTVDAA